MACDIYWLYLNNPTLEDLQQQQSKVIMKRGYPENVRDGQQYNNRLKSEPMETQSVSSFQINCILIFSIFTNCNENGAF